MTGPFGRRGPAADNRLVTKEPTIRAVVFDLDDTLYLERDYVRSGYAVVARRLRQQLGRDEPFEDWLWRRFVAGKYDRAFDALSEHFDLGLSDEQIGQLVAVYRQHKPDIRPGEGIVDLLNSLQGRGRLGILTDGLLPAQQLKLEALKIAQFFDAVLFTESLGRDAWKPSAAGFQAIVGQLDVPHSACAYVADNPAKDFIAPNSLGWRTIQYKCEGQIHSHKSAPPGGQPKVVVNRPEEVLTAVS